MDAFSELLDDLAAEHRALDGVLTAMADAQWNVPTHAPGWLVRDQVAHLAHFDEMSVLAIADSPRFRADAAAPRDTRPSREERYLRRGRSLPPADLLAWWRRASAAVVDCARPLDSKARLPWYGPDMSAASFVTARLMETWSHGLDVVDVVGIARLDSDRLRHVAFLGVRTREFSYTNRGLAPDTTPVFVQLTAPSGAIWTFGEPSAEERITGPARDFCRVVTQRRHVDDTELEIVGQSAHEWMALAQAFAGPPGQGRKPHQFPVEGR
jgi:uncharacterized protein (TIGR03084 family)